jgi:[acyl-carrier-protein] S-malonyltransferase
MFERLGAERASAEVLEAASQLLGEDPRRLALDERRYDNRIAQPLICAVQLTAWSALRELLPAPRLFAGYSLGELAAYGCAGALTAEDTLRLAQRRAALMEEASPSEHGMLALRGLPRRIVEALSAAHGAQIAIDNGPAHFILGGTQVGLAALAGEALASGAEKAERLPIGVPSHTSWLAPAAAAFRRELERAGLADPATPVVAGISGALVRRRDEIIATLSAQIAAPVTWAGCLESAVECGCRTFVELPPGASLMRMLRELHPQVEARAVEEFGSLQGVADWVARVTD